MIPVLSPPTSPTPSPPTPPLVSAPTGRPIPAAALPQRRNWVKKHEHSNSILQDSTTPEVRKALRKDPKVALRLEPITPWIPCHARQPRPCHHCRVESLLTLGSSPCAAGPGCARDLVEDCCQFAHRRRQRPRRRPRGALFPTSTLAPVQQAHGVRQGPVRVRGRVQVRVRVRVRASAATE